MLGNVGTAHLRLPTLSQKRLLHLDFFIVYKLFIFIFAHVRIQSYSFMTIANPHMTSFQQRALKYAFSDAFFLFCLGCFCLRQRRGRKTGKKSKLVVLQEIYFGIMFSAKMYVQFIYGYVVGRKKYENTSDVVFNSYVF